MKIGTSILALVVCSLPALVDAHVSVTGPGFANATQELTFPVGHGCSGADTYRIRIAIPSGVTSLRPMRSDFGRIGLEKDAAGSITAVTWQRPDTDVLDSDIAYYKLVIRMKLPDQPFSTLYFPAVQTCRAPDGALSTTNWTMLPTDPVVDGGADEPAPTLRVVPARRIGWNKFVVPVAVPDLSVFFSDALIVWKGAAAYSASPTTAELIAGTAGVTALSSLAANDEIWVKY